MSRLEGLGDRLVPTQEPEASTPLVDDSAREPLREVATERRSIRGLGERLAGDTVTSTLREAVKANPDEHAKAARIAKQTGTTAQIVAPSIKDFEAQIAFDKLNTEKLAKDFSVTAGFLSNYDNAAQLHDDVDTLTKMETWVKNKASYLEGRFDRGAAVVELGKLQSREVYTRLGIPGGVEHTDEERRRIDHLRTLLQAADNEQERSQFMLALGAAAEQVPILGSMLDAGARPLAEGLATGAAAGATAALVAGNASPLLLTPEEVLTVPAGMVAGGTLGLRSMLPVAKAATIKGILDVEVGNAYDEYIRMDDGEQTLDPQVAAYAAGAYGVVAAGLESFALGKLGKVFSGPKDAFNRVIKNRIKTILKDKTTRQKVIDLGTKYAELIATEGITEALQEGSQVVFGAFAKYADSGSFTEQDMSKVLDEIFSMETLDTMTHAAAEGSRAAAVFGAAGTVTTVAMDGVRAEARAEGEQRKIDELAALVKESKGVQRNPEAVREFLQQAVAEEDNVYLRAESVLEYLVDNDIDPYGDPVFQGMAAQIDEAASLGGDVVIPVPDFAVGIAASDHFEALRPHMRLSADTVAPAEAKAAQQQQQSFIAQLMAEAESEATVYAEAQEVYETVREQLLGTGRANPQVAKLQAQVIPAYVTRLAKQTGRGVRDLFAEMAPQIVGPLAEQQASNAARAAQMTQEANRLATVKTGDMVDGYTVRDEVPNMDSIAATLDDYTILEGVREVPMSAFDPEYLGSISAEGLDQRTRNLMEQIQSSKELNPLIVAYDSKGAYIIEGGHRFDALIASGVKSIPAVVVIDESDAPAVQMDQDGIEYDQSGNIVTESENFKRWFGDSKVVDESGAPLVVYHGTRAEFDTFDLDKVGSATDSGVLGTGFYFSTDKRVVEKDQREIAVYLNLNNPLRIALPDFSKEKLDAISEALGIQITGINKESSDAIREAAIAQGYDGVILDYSATGYNHKEVVAFDPTQIKSVFNRGTFDPTDPNILNQQNNASGESAASLEAIGVEKSRKRQGIQHFIVDSRSGRSRPAIGPRPEDNPLNPYDVLVQVKDGRSTVVNQGRSVRDTSKATTLFQSQDQTQTEAFKKWFADSKVVDESGKPLVVYHGSPDIRGVIKEGFKHRPGGRDSFFATDSYRMADSYADDQRAFDYQNAEPYTVALYLSIQNPMIVDAAGANWKETEKHLAEARDKGHDGIIIKNSIDFYNTEKGQKPATVYVFFESTQAKSAMTGKMVSRVDGITLAEDAANRGTFDPNNPDIRYQNQPQPRGSYDVGANLIRLTEASDLSTFLHESAHFFLEMERKFNPAGVQGVNEWLLRNAADVALEANGYLGRAGAVEQSAYHGTPHEVDRFSLQKIGTGEGAQAYGWGLYFAESRDVAEWYRDKLSDSFNAKMRVIQDAVPGTSDAIASRIVSNLVYEKVIPASAVKMTGYANRDYRPFVTENESALITAAEQAQDAKAPGRLYTVELAPKDDEWLLWDKPLSEQSEKVQKAIAESGLLKFAYDTPRYELTGEEFYRRVSTHFGKEGRNRAVGMPALAHKYGAEEASHTLNSIGIHGIKYLDGTSRNKGDGNFNFVLFDDSMVEITAFEQSQDAPGGAAGSITEEHVRAFLTEGGTGDKAIDDAINRAGHEWFARGFETYLMEGKAPSLELRDAFRAFARWLTDLYRKVRGDLSVNLDDEMRQVFDRMLATEDQIAAVEAANRYAPLFTDAAMAGMTEEEFAAYQKRSPTDKAKETLREKILKELTRQTEDWWKKEKAERTAVITEQLKTQKVYAASEQLRLKGGELKLDRAAVKEMLGVERVPDRLRGMTLTGMQGVSPDDAAAFLGYDSGHQMVTEIMAARPIREVAAEQAEAEMKAEHGDILTDGTLEREAQDAAHNEERGQQILTEMKTLARQQNRPSLDRAAIKQLAGENIARLPLTRILPAKYRRAEIRAAQAAQAAMTKGDRQGALAAKTQQAMNFYLWRAATDARERAEKMTRSLRKYDRKTTREALGKAGNGYLEQIDGLLERFTLTGSVRAAQADRADIAEWAAERSEAGDNIQLSREALSEQMRMHYREIPFEKFVGVYESIKNIDHVARFANKVRKDGELLDFLEVKREVLTHLDALPKKFKTFTSVARRQTVGRSVRWGVAQMTKLPVLFTWLDGGNRAGLMHRLLGQPFTDAASERLRIYEEVGKPVVEAITSRSKADRKRHAQKVHIPEAVTGVNDGTFMRHELISVALNTGNLSNLEKMLKGEGWVAEDSTDEEISVNNPKLQAVLAHLTESDWTLVETIWKQIDLLYPRMAEVHKRTSGLDLPKIQAVPFVLPSGRRIEGGYYPVKYDPDRSDRAEQNERRQQATIDSMFGPGGMLKPSANTGAKIERTGFFAPIRFSLDVVPNHIDEVIQYITHFEAVQQVYKLTHDPEIKQAIRERVGKDEFDQIAPWLNDIAKEGRESSVKKQLWDPLLRRLRFGTTLGMMGFKASTGLMQISGLSNSVGELGPRYMARAMRHVLGSLGSRSDARAMWEFVAERSKIMGDRTSTMDRELMNAMNAIRDKSGLLKAAQEASMKHIAYIQTYSVDLPTWYGAYYKGLDEAKAQLDAEDFASFDAYSSAVEEQAVRRADWTVENVQGSGMTKDMARIQRNQTETGKMLTMFFTFFSSMWNMQRDSVRGARSGQYSVTTLAAKLLFIYMIPVAYEMALRGDLEDDDDETALEKYLTNLAIYPAMTVPVLRDGINAAVTGFDFNMTPIAGIIEKGVKGSTKVGEAALTDGEITAAQAKNTVKLGGALLGIPGVSQAWSTGEHLYDVIEEGDELTMRELLFGPRRD